MGGVFLGGWACAVSFIFVYFRLFSCKSMYILRTFLFTFAYSMLHTMAKVKLFLDKRRANRDNSYPIRLYIYHRSQIYLSTGVNAALHEWSAEAGCLLRSDPSARATNARLRDLLNRAEMLLLNLSVSGELAKMTDKMLAQRVQQELHMTKHSRASLIDYLEKAKNGKAERTKRLFTWAQQRVEAFDAKVNVSDVDEAWMTRFRDALLENYAPNTVAQGMAWVSRALSLAIADGLMTRNPCAAVKKPRAATRKRAVTLETLRMLRDCESAHPRARYARDIFLLQLYLRGINIVDLRDLAEIVDGRVEYARHKTGTLYSVKIEPEAMEIIDRWRGDGRLVDFSNYHTAGSACSAITGALKRINPLLSTNAARHTWATLAAELEIPMETISHALGHQIGSPVTAIYVAYNQKKVDDANRRVIDYVNADLRAKTGK